MPNPTEKTRAELTTAVEALLRAAGRDLNDADFSATPSRVARLWLEDVLIGYRVEPEQILADPVLGEADPQAVMIHNLSFHSMCPHHLLPYRGLVHVGYIPDGKLAGFGRIAELVKCFSRRLTLQERITRQIAQALIDHLGAKGAGCAIEAEQLCLALPSDEHRQSTVLTTAFLGEFERRPELREALLRPRRGQERHLGTER
jgi:GTP cyclohydrolase I